MLMHTYNITFILLWKTKGEVESEWMFVTNFRNSNISCVSITLQNHWKYTQWKHVNMSVCFGRKLGKIEGKEFTSSTILNMMAQTQKKTSLKKYRSNFGQICNNSLAFYNQRDFYLAGIQNKCGLPFIHFHVVHKHKPVHNLLKYKRRYLEKCLLCSFNGSA